MGSDSNYSEVADAVEVRAVVEDVLDGVLARAGVEDLDAAAACGDVGADHERGGNLGLLEAGQAEAGGPLGVGAIARIAGARVSNIRLQFVNGKITEIAAAANETALRGYLSEGSALRSFREFALGFNPKLHAPQGSPWVAYYGYGAGMVRLSLGDNSELGGNVRGGAVHWFFFPGADVTISGKSIF